MKKLLCLLLLCLLPLLALADSSLQVTVDDVIHCYGENTINITVPADGTVTVTVSAGGQVYRTLSDLPVQAGENALSWDGLGPWQERIPDGTYTLSAAFTDRDGSTGSAECAVKVSKCRQALLYALPSSDTLYQEDSKTWFVQLELIRAGKVVFEVYAAESPETLLYSKKVNITGGAKKYYWQGTLSGKEQLAPGSYMLKWYAADNPAYVHSFSLTVADGTTP